MTLIPWPNASVYIIMCAYIRLLPAMTVPALVILTGRLMRILIKTLAAKSPAPKTVQHVLPAYVLSAAADITSAMIIHAKRKKAVLQTVPTVTKRPAYVLSAAADITFPATDAFPVRKMQLVTENQSTVTTVTRKRMEFASHRKQFIPARHI